MSRIWNRFLREYGDAYCVCRFGDDFGFATATLLAPEDIREHIIPQYRKIIDAVHRAGKPFLLHSCGKIFDVMEDLIAAGIDAKHSNEDKIAPFPVWVERYGDRIGNFGGIDMNCLCELDRAQMYDYISDVVRRCKGHGGFAFGTGNSIADYVPPEGCTPPVGVEGLQLIEFCAVGSVREGVFVPDSFHQRPNRGGKISANYFVPERENLALLVTDVFANQQIYLL